MSERIYGWLLKLYPVRFRTEYGDAMRQVFRDRVNGERRGVDRLRLWFDVLRDLAVSVPREHRRGPAAVAQPGTYLLSEEALRKASQSRLGSISYLCLTMALGLVIGLAGNAPHGLLFGFYSLFAALMIATSILDGLRRRDRLRGFEVELQRDRILIKDHGRVVKTMLRTEVTILREVRHGSRLVGLSVGKGIPGEWFVVPSSLTGYDELREQLSSWGQAAEPWTLPSGLRRRHLTWTFAIWPAAFLVTSPHYVWPLAAIVGGALLLLAASLRRKKLGPLPLLLFPAGLAALLVMKVLLPALSQALARQ